MPGFDGIQGPRSPLVGPLAGDNAGPPRNPNEITGAPVSESGFGELLKKSIESVADFQNDVKGKMEGLVTGETEDVHEVLLAMGKAEVAFSMMLEIRNRLVESWRELTRIQV